MQELPAILVIGQGFRPELLSTPRDLGFRVVLLDSGKPADQSLYDDYIEASAVDAEAALGAVRDYISGGRMISAVACFFEGGLHVAAEISKELGLPGNSPETVRNMCDKLQTWHILSRAGIPTPRTVLPDCARAALKAAEEFGYPVIVKPQASAASKGVIKAHDAHELAQSFALVSGLFSTTSFGSGHARIPNIGKSLFYPGAHGVLVQEYIEGFEICVDIVYSHGQFSVLGIVDKPQAWEEPYFPECMFVAPSHLPAATQATIRDISVRALQAMGATAGAAHIELRVSPEGPKVIEVNGRIGGPSILLQETLLSVTGRWGPAEYINVITGGAVCEEPSPGRTAGFSSLPVERPGRIVRFDGEDKVRALPGVARIQWAKRIGQFIPEGYTRNPSVMFAHVMVEGESWPQVVETLADVRLTLHAVTENP
jgi:biotin carboxylase